MESQPHTRLYLVSTEQKFYLFPTDSQPKEVLVIDKLTCDISLTNPSTVGTELSRGQRRTICILLGMVRLLSGPYLIVGTAHREVGSIDSQKIFEMTRYELIPFLTSTLHLTQSQERDNRVFVAMMQRVLDTPGFYYSYTYDLSHTRQRIQQLVSEGNHTSQSLFNRADERFMWNSHLLKDFVVQPELQRFLVPLVHGFVSIRTCTINSKTFDFVLLSRRSWHRAGVRYFMRGIDNDGNCANFVETEQLAVHDGNISSFVQTRGSIPMHWSQMPTLKYKPNPCLSKNNTIQASGIQKHFDEQIVLYGQQTAINLINQSGSEKSLGDAFKHSINSLSSVLISYNAFDFHKECSKMRWHRLNILTDRLNPTLEQYGYFVLAKDGRILSWQKGVFRTNCIDCLDRTNVVQSLLARKSLSAQLKVFGILHPSENLENKKEFESTFKNVWADNGDQCARQYAGTGALKADFTRTGKRTHVGMLRDGYKSAMRYYYNNFADGFRQDSIDLFLGNYRIDPWVGVSVPSPLNSQRSLIVRMLPLLLLVGVSMLFISIIVPSSDPMWQLVYVLFWGAIVCVVLVYVYKNGTDFVDYPKLIDRPDNAKKQN